MSKPFAISESLFEGIMENVNVNGGSIRERKNLLQSIRKELDDRK